MAAAPFFVDKNAASTIQQDEDRDFLPPRRFFLLFRPSSRSSTPALQNNTASFRMMRH